MLYGVPLNFIKELKTIDPYVKSLN